MHRYLAGERRVPDDVAKRALEHLDESEFREAVGASRGWKHMPSRRTLICTTL